MRWQGMTHEQWLQQSVVGWTSFAWFPVQCRDGSWVWLEDYYWRLETKPEFDPGFMEAVNYRTWPLPEPDALTQRLHRNVLSGSQERGVSPPRLHPRPSTPPPRDE